MEEKNKNAINHEKSLKDQVIDKMISTLKDSENFSNELLKSLEEIDLSSKNDVKTAISEEGEEKLDEDT